MSFPLAPCALLIHSSKSSPDSLEIFCGMIVIHVIWVAIRPTHIILLAIDYGSAH
ncbi:hypothetical protein [Emticicia sp. BO119]|uniref:hypothetical protein n=1 Tax=Emticicia sp. BO119 TaxID=2757768 RepID=UPI0015F112E2|nr:hypothetical protein [Emticicia sp. BO119]MBA4853006.1 hypothetical protein [Emticicia sp. BO119]